MRFPIPSRETTPAEYAVLVVFAAAFFIIVGLISLVVAFRAPPEKHDLAVALEHRGLVLVGVGVAIAFLYWVYRRLKD